MLSFACDSLANTNLTAQSLTPHLPHHTPCKLGVLSSVPAQEWHALGIALLLVSSGCILGVCGIVRADCCHGLEQRIFDNFVRIQVIHAETPCRVSLARHNKDFLAYLPKESYGEISVVLSKHSLLQGRKREENADWFLSQEFSHFLALASCAR